MKARKILEVLKEETGFNWDEPFSVKMGVIRRMIDKYDFRLNHIFYMFRQMEAKGVANIIKQPDENLSSSEVVVEFPEGISEEFYSWNKPNWEPISILDTIMYLQWHKEPIHKNPSGIPYPMKTCRILFDNYGFAYNEQIKMLVQLTNDGYMKILDYPHESLSDDVVVAVLIKCLPRKYYDEHKDRWR